MSATTDDLGLRPVNENPTDRQKAAGNFQKAPLYVHGMRITVENPAGTTRKGTDEDGNAWESKLTNHYGYIRGTTGRDKDHLDVFLGPNVRDANSPAHVIDQLKGDGSFDEHKVMLGFPDEDSAINAYHANYGQGHRGFGDITTVPVGDLKQWAFNGGARHKPMSELVKYKDAGQRAPGYAAGGQVQRDANGVPIVGSYSTLPGGTGGGLSKAAVAKTQQPKQQPSSMPSKSGVGALRSNPLTNPGGVINDQLNDVGEGNPTPDDVKDYADGGPVAAPEPSVAGFLSDPQSYKDMGRNALALGNRAMTGIAGFPVDMTNLALHADKAIVGSRLPLSDKPVGGTEWLRDKLNSIGSPTTTGNATADNWGDAATGALSMAPSATAALVGRGLKGLGTAAAKPVAQAMEGSGPLAKMLAPSAPAYAVKPKGGNWVDANLDSYLEGVGANKDPAVQAWATNQLKRHLKTYAGTAEDPLLKLEAQGQLHIRPDDLLDASSQAGISNVTNAVPVEGQPPVVFPVRARMNREGLSPVDKLHLQLTDRTYRTPWENLADQSVSPDTSRGEAIRQVALTNGLPSTTPTVSDIAARPWANPDREAELMKQYGWLDKQSPDAKFNSLNYSHGDPMQFGHVLDYLNAAKSAGDLNAEYAAGRLNRAAMINGGDSVATAHGLIDRNLHLSPDQLARTSVPDAVAKTAQWNDLLDKQKALVDMNQGVKSVLKSYPETGHQWVELSPEGLKAEGDAMRHCVGGYCSQVQDGSTRILSLRDAKGQPAATVEVRPGRNDPISDAHRELSSEEMKSIRDEAMSRDPSGEPWGHQGDFLSPEVADRRRELTKQVFLERHPEVANLQPTPSIQQIKGPANRAPSAAVLPYVQDLVKGQVPGLPAWERVGDLQNSGMSQVRQPVEVNASVGLSGKRLKATINPGYYTSDSLIQHLKDQGFPESEAASQANMFTGIRKYAVGGLVQNNNPVPPTPPGAPTPQSASGGITQQTQGGLQGPSMQQLSGIAPLQLQGPGGLTPAGTGQAAPTAPVGGGSNGGPDVMDNAAGMGANYLMNQGAKAGMYALGSGLSSAAGTGAAEIAGGGVGGLAAADSASYAADAAGNSAVPYAGAALSALQGNYKGAAGQAAGTYIGTMIMPGIGTVIGGLIGGMVGNKCFITTATLRAGGHTNDDAFELHELRKFRDHVMNKDPELAKLVQEYELLSPAIVSALDKHPAAQKIYQQLHRHFVFPAAVAVSHGDYRLAVTLYVKMIEKVAPLAVHYGDKKEVALAAIMALDAKQVSDHLAKTNRLAHAAG